MFNAPAQSNTSVFAKLHEKDHYPEGTSSWLDIQRPGIKPSSFIEGPAFDSKGNLWFCDIPWGRIFRIPPGGKIELVVRYDGEPNGLAFGPDGLLYIADFRNGLMVLEPDSGQINTIAHSFAETRFKGLNDLIFAKNGDLYFTDQGLTGLHDPSGRLFRLSRAGQLECLLNNVPSPNGLVLSPDERSILLAVTRDNAVWRVPLLSSGGVYKVGVFVRLSGGGGPDGLALDPHGNLIVCHLGLGSIWVFDPYGEPIRRIRSCMGQLTTNATFGTAPYHALYITESETGSILKANIDW